MKINHPLLTLLGGHLQHIRQDGLLHQDTLQDGHLYQVIMRDGRLPQDIQRGGHLLQDTRVTGLTGGSK